MRYIGGKSRLARSIAQVILSREASREYYVEPFVGGGSVLAHMAPEFTRTEALDLSPDLIMMWQSLMSGWEPPLLVSEAEYAALKNKEPSPERGLIGFGGSFGGKWFGGYARGGFQANGEPRNHQAESARAVLKIRDAIVASDVRFRNADYRQAGVQAGSVVYCDPPYSGTEEYQAVERFDSQEFWLTMRRWSDAGANVYVSEYAAPEGWQCVWEQTHRQSLTQPKQGREARVERLWTPSKNNAVRP